MNYTTLIDTHELAAILNDCTVVDCRAQLSDTNWGEREYTAAHIPGAYFAHLERDLSGPIIAGKTGRHPLPDLSRLKCLLGTMGIIPDRQVVVYDQDNGAFAARLWWLLRYLGQDTVAVLNGGWRAWCAAGLPTQADLPKFTNDNFRANVRSDRVVNADTVLKNTTIIPLFSEPGAQDKVLIDVRAPARFAGLEEPIDPVAGHIPGAVNRPFMNNVDAQGRFLDLTALKNNYAQDQDKQAIFYCGSGVTACHGILAWVHAGLSEPQLYAGSWSEWICDPTHPIA